MPLSPHGWCPEGDSGSETRHSQSSNSCHALGGMLGSHGWEHPLEPQPVLRLSHLESSPCTFGTLCVQEAPFQGM